MGFYLFTQNNSGGFFEVDEVVCHRLIIEADTYDEAEIKAKSLGVYFNGCEQGIDCSCCGDRWDTGRLIDIEELNKKGYEVNVYNLYEDPENRWQIRYGKYEVFEKPKWINDGFRRFEGKIKFKNIVEYIQFLADEYGWTTQDTLDARIFYKNGDVKEIYKSKT